MSCTRILRKRKTSNDHKEEDPSVSQEEHNLEEQLQETPEANSKEETPTKKAKPCSDDVPLDTPADAPEKASTPEPPVEQGKKVDDLAPNSTSSIVAVEQ